LLFHIYYYTGEMPCITKSVANAVTGEVSKKGKEKVKSIICGADTAILDDNADWIDTIGLWLLWGWVFRMFVKQNLNWLKNTR